MNWKICVTAIVLSALWAQPSLAQDIDLSAVDSFLTSILDAMTGLTGRLVMTIIAIGVLIAGAFNYIDWSRVFVLLIIIVIIGVIPTVIESIWGAGE